MCYEFTGSMPREGAGEHPIGRLVYELGELRVEGGLAAVQEPRQPPD